MTKNHLACVFGAILGIATGVMAAPYAFEFGYNLVPKPNKTTPFVERVWPDTFEHLHKRTE